MTLLRGFLAASAVILAVGAIVLSSRLSNDLRRAELMTANERLRAKALCRNNNLEK